MEGSKKLLFSQHSHDVTWRASRFHIKLLAHAVNVIIMLC